MNGHKWECRTQVRFGEEAVKKHLPEMLEKQGIRGKAVLLGYGGGSIKMIANIIWLILSGIPMAIGYVVVGGLWCITIVGIPFGKQFFKLAKLALMPFGAKVV